MYISAISFTPNELNLPTDANIYSYAFGLRENMLFHVFCIEKWCIVELHFVISPLHNCLFTLVLQAFYSLNLVNIIRFSIYHVQIVNLMNLNTENYLVLKLNKPNKSTKRVEWPRKEYFVPYNLHAIASENCSFYDQGLFRPETLACVI